jgi:hypothetical protein
MNGVDRHQLIVALLAAITALFLIAGLPPLAPWRRALQRTVIVAYLCVLAFALVEVAVWLSSGAR